MRLTKENKILETRHSLSCFYPTILRKNRRYAHL